MNWLFPPYPPLPGPRARGGGGGRGVRRVTALESGHTVRVPGKHRIFLEYSWYNIN